MKVSRTGEAYKKIGGKELEELSRGQNIYKYQPHGCKITLN